GEGRAHPVDGVEIVPGRALVVARLLHRRPEPFPAAVVAGEELRRGLAHMAGAEAEDQAVEGHAAALRDAAEKVGGRAFAPALAPAQFGSVAGFEMEDVGRFAQPAIGEEGLDGLRAEALDVEGVAGDEMLELLDLLRRTDEVAGAVMHCLAGLAHDVGAADGAGFGKDIGDRVRRPAGEVDILDLRDDVAGAVDRHPVTDADVAALPDGLPPGLAAGDGVGIVKGGVLDNDAAHGDRREAGDGREGAGAADLDLDGPKLGGGAFGGKLVGKRPAWCRGTRAETRLQVEAVELVDHTVDVVAEIGPLSLDAAVVSEKLLQFVAEDDKRVGRQPESREALYRTHLRIGEGLRNHAP